MSSRSFCNHSIFSLTTVFCCTNDRHDGILSGGEALAAANEDMASWIDILDSCKFYPTAKAEWADVKQGVINVEQNALLGGDVQELLDDLQSEIAG